MRSCVEPGCFELCSDISKCLTRTIAERNGVLANHPIDVERPETNALHMERANRVAERVTLGKKRVARRTMLLCFYLSDQHLQTVVGSFSVIGCGHMRVVSNDPEMVI